MSVRLLQMIGYWSASDAKDLAYFAGCPDPADVTGSWQDPDRELVLEYLRSGATFRAFMGHSPCLVCEEPNGSTELTDGEWAWPEGLAHYVSEHGVRLPEAFVDKVLNGRQLPAGLQAEIGEPQVYLDGGRGIAIPTNPDQQPNVALRYETWLDWAAANTPAKPMAGAVSLDEARAVANRLSHSAWQADIEPVHGRWQVSFTPGDERIYLQRCSAKVLTRCLGERRPSDPLAILDIEQADAIAASFDGDWGAARILAVATGAWFVWVKPADAEWPTSDDIRKQTSGRLELGWKRNHPGNSQSFAVREMDEFGWRQTLERIRADRRQALKQEK